MQGSKDTLPSSLVVKRDFDRSRYEDRFLADAYDLLLQMQDAVSIGRSAKPSGQGVEDDTQHILVQQESV